MSYTKYTDDPGLLVGVDIDLDKENCCVYLRKRGTADAVDGFRFDAEDEARECWSHLMQAKFAWGLTEGKSKSRQWFAHGEGQKRVSNSTGWVRPGG